MSETIEQWAERVAPDANWVNLRHWEEDGCPEDSAYLDGLGMTPRYARALLARRNKVAARLSPAMRRDLPSEWCWPYPSQATAGALQQRGLLVPGTWERTNLGHEIARVLRGER